MLEITNLHAETNEGKKILNGINLKLEKGVNVLMGPNGSGKSTLAQILMGNKKYKITSGKIIFNEEDITDLSPDKRARLGIFLSFQNPIEVSGVVTSNFLRTAYNSLKPKMSFLEFGKMIKEKTNSLEMKEEFLERYLNHGFSGGEKKKSEILQLSVLSPEFSILDEIDSGLDVDSLKAISNQILKLAKEGKSFLIITHHKKILDYLSPDKVFIMLDGKIALSGKKELLDVIEKKGYKGMKN